MELNGSIYDIGEDDRVSVYISAKSVPSSPVADELRRIHAAGGMFCSMRPAQKMRKTAEQSGRPGAPVRIGSEEAQRADGQGR